MPIKIKKKLIYIVLLSFGTMLVMDSCKTSGKVGCGCGADINKVNKVYKKRYQR